MAVNALMQHQTEGRVYVPPQKVDEYLAKGYVIVEPADPQPQVLKVEQVPEPEPAAPVEKEAQAIPEVTLEEAVQLKRGSKRPRKA